MNGATITSAHVCTQPTQEAASAPAGSNVLGTLAKDYVPKYLLWATRDQQAADRLKQMFRKRKDGPERDAIWEGSWALQGKVEHYIECLRDRGGLLFFGQAPAIAAAHSVVEGGAA